MKLKTIATIAAIGLLLGGCEPPPPEIKYTVLEVIECDHHDNCAVKVDKNPWITNVDGGTTVVPGDYILHPYDIKRRKAYYIDGHDPRFEYDMEDWGDD